MNDQMESILSQIFYHFNGMNNNEKEQANEYVIKVVQERPSDCFLVLIHMIQINENTNVSIFAASALRLLIQNINENLDFSTKLSYLTKLNSILFLERPSFSLILELYRNLINCYEFLPHIYDLIFYCFNFIQTFNAKSSNKINGNLFQHLSVLYMAASKLVIMDFSYDNSDLYNSLFSSLGPLLKEKSDYLERRLILKIFYKFFHIRLIDQPIFQLFFQNILELFSSFPDISTDQFFNEKFVKFYKTTISLCQKSFTDFYHLEDSPEFGKNFCNRYSELLFLTIHKSISNPILIQNQILLSKLLYNASLLCEDFPFPIELLIQLIPLMKLRSDDIEDFSQNPAVFYNTNMELHFYEQLLSLRIPIARILKTISSSSNYETPYLLALISTFALDEEYIFAFSSIIRGYSKIGQYDSKILQVIRQYSISLSKLNSISLPVLTSMLVFLNAELTIPELMNQEDIENLAAFSSSISEQMTSFCAECPLSASLMLLSKIFLLKKFPLTNEMIKNLISNLPHCYSASSFYAAKELISSNSEINHFFIPMIPFFFAKIKECSYSDLNDQQQSEYFKNCRLLNHILEILNTIYLNVDRSVIPEFGNLFCQTVENFIDEMNPCFLEVLDNTCKLASSMISKNDLLSERIIEITFKLLENDYYSCRIQVNFLSPGYSYLLTNFTDFCIQTKFTTNAFNLLLNLIPFCSVEEGFKVFSICLNLGWIILIDPSHVIDFYPKFLSIVINCYPKQIYGDDYSESQYQHGIFFVLSCFFNFFHVEIPLSILENWVQFFQQCQLFSLEEVLLFKRAFKSVLIKYPDLNHVLEPILFQESTLFIKTDINYSEEPFFLDLLQMAQKNIS